jgi:hypothetical protein
MSDGETKSRKARPYWLPVIIAFIMWLVLTYFYFTPEAVDRTRFTFDEWKNIGYLVTSIMLVWLFIWKITLNTEVVSEIVEEEPATESKAKAKKADETEVEEEPPKPKKKRVVVKAPAAAAAAATAAALDDELSEGKHPPKDVEEDLMDLPRVIEWEKKEPGGVYSDTLIRVDENLVLNLRTLLGKVCHNCEELDDCKRRIEGKVDEDIFLHNFECKDGLKKELNKARKKREKEEEKAAAAKDMVEEKAATAKDDEEEEKAPTKKKATPSKKKTTTSKKKKVTKSTKKKPSTSSSSAKKTKSEETK